MNRKILKIILKEILMLLLQFIFSKIYICGFSPAGFSFAIIRIFRGHNIFCVTIEYALSKILNYASFNIMCITAYEIVVLSLYYFAIEFIKTNKKVFMIIMFLILSKALELYFSILEPTILIYFLVSFGVEILVTLYFYKFFTSYKDKFLFYKFGNLDYLFFSFMIMLISLGTFSYEFVSKFAGLGIIVLLLIILCKVLPEDKFLTLSIVVAVSVFIITKTQNLLYFCIIFAAFIVNFKNLNKYLYCLACIVFFLGILLIERKFELYLLLSFLMPVIIYVVLPNNLILKFSNSFENSSLNAIIQNMQDLKIEKMQTKINLMSKTFSMMRDNFKFLIVGKINRKLAANELTSDVIENCCKMCENYKYCYFQNIDKKTMISELIYNAVQNGSISREDMSNGFLAYCMKTGILVSEINSIAQKYLSYEVAMKTEDSSKLIISSEFDNISNIFKNFAKIFKYSLKINKNLSNFAKDALIESMIDAKEVVILEDNKGIDSIVVVAENDVLLKKELQTKLSKIVNNKVKIQTMKHLEYSGISQVTFVPVPKFRADFAIANSAKEKTSGDSFVISKIDENKYFVAIADGMGHGEKASKISSMVIELIQSMFQVGFESEFIVESINRLLLPAGLDNFTTIDACIIDLENQVCDFVKLGSSVSILKRRNTAEVISCDSLPMGIVQNIKPTIVRKNIECGDIIFLASDGVVDAFESIDIYKSFINDAKIFNLQKYVDTVLQDAMFGPSKHVDDMTIIGINLLKN